MPIGLLKAHAEAPDLRDGADLGGRGGPRSRGSNAEVRMYLHLPEAGEGGLTHSIDRLELSIWRKLYESRRNEVGMGSGEIFMERRTKCAKYKILTRLLRWGRLLGVKKLPACQHHPARHVAKKNQLPDRKRVPRPPFTRWTLSASIFKMQEDKQLYRQSCSTSNFLVTKTGKLF